MGKIRAYYYLTKPGIIQGNALTGAAGFFLASQKHPNWSILLAFLIGMSLVIACACVLNNIVDKDIDAKMERTQKRAIVTGKIGPVAAAIYALILGLVGSVVLYKCTNVLTLALGLFGVFAYVVLYGYFKRSSHHGTVVGSISGALPPVAGYTAVTNRFDAAALLLFFTVVFWQMPHFYSIAIYRLAEYKKAGIPVLPIKKGYKITKLQIMIYILGFSVSASLLATFGHLGALYFLAVLLLGGGWFVYGLRGFQTKDAKHWARQMFFISLIVISLWCVSVSMASLL